MQQNHLTNARPIPFFTMLPKLAAVHSVWVLVHQWVQLFCYSGHPIFPQRMQAVCPDTATPGNVGKYNEHP